MWRSINARVALMAAYAMVAGAGFAAAANAAVPPDLATTPPGMHVERVILLFRHGVRAPLDEEIGAKAYARAPWPAWSTAPGLLTPHGREGMRQLGSYDRGWFAALGLLPASGCPEQHQVWIWTNTEERTIASGEELAEGLAPGCQLTVNHLAPGTRDPLFDAAAAAPEFDATQAVRLIETETGGPQAIIAPHLKAVRTLETLLGCGTPSEAEPCDIAQLPASLGVSDDGRGLRLRGPIDVTSGTAEVFLLEYAEGMPVDRVGWGRATPRRLAEVSRLHALLFDIFDRPSVMAHRTAARMAPRIAALVSDADSPAVTLLVGHDNNIAALAALLGVHFQIPGYGQEDPPPGGALGVEVLRQAGSKRIFVRTFYQAQTLSQLRALTRLDGHQPPALEVLAPRCAVGPQHLCSVESFRALLSDHNPTLQPSIR